MIEKIIKILSEYTEVEDIKTEHKLRDDLGMDSLDFIEITLDLEEEYGIQIPDSVIDEVAPMPVRGEPNSTTVGQVIELIEKFLEHE